MGDLRLSSILRLAREAIELGSDFGLETLEALAWVAQTVESSVYVRDSLTRTPSGICFSLANPPLRIGAFSSVRLFVDGRPVPPDRVRVRTVPVGPWRAASQLGVEEPLELQGGVGLEFEADAPVEGPLRPLSLRIELQNVAIPPLVWLELHETPREAALP